MKTKKTTQLIINNRIYFSESSSVGKSGGCFPGRSIVRTESGAAKPLEDLRLGERVASLNSRGDIVYSEVIAFLDRSPTESRQFVRLTTESGRSLTLTPAHLVPIERGASVFAARVKVGDRILVRDRAEDSFLTNDVSSDAEDRLRWDRVVEARLVLEEGVYAPLTNEGTLLVDDVVASCYAVVDSQTVAHYAFLPLRIFKSAESTIYGIARYITGGRNGTLSRPPETARSQTVTNSIELEDRGRHDKENQGVHWYASTLYALAPYVLPERMFY